jgi:hypothetical protein
MSSADFAFDQPLKASRAREDERELRALVRALDIR